MTMKLKYYLRGLGTGVLVTALVLGIALSHGKGTITDEEVKKRASELGMVEEFKSLEEASKEKEEEEAVKEAEEEASKQVDESNESIVSGNDSADEKKNSGFGTGIEKEEQTDSKQPAENEKKKSEENQQAEVKEKNVTDNGQADHALTEKEKLAEGNVTEAEKMVVLEVSGGDGSMTVAKKAEAAGLVSSATEFDRFLCNGGYDKKICTGKHEIPAGATMEEIARLLIRKP